MLRNDNERELSDVTRDSLRKTFSDSTYKENELHGRDEDVVIQIRGYLPRAALVGRREQKEGHETQ